MRKTVMHRPIPLPHTRSSAQRGFTLVELLVGVIIGLLVVAVALGAMMGSRAVSGSTGDLSQIQQQAAYAFRVLARQIRQSGNLHLKSEQMPHGRHQFKIHANADTFDMYDTLDGSDNPGIGQYKLVLRSRKYHAPDGSNIQVRDCLGENSSGDMLESSFVLDLETNQATGHPKYELKCRSSKGQVQPLIQNVADFQVRYVVEQKNAGGQPLLHYVNLASIADRKEIVGIEVCLVLFGTERMATDGMPPENLHYTGCTPASGGAAPSVDITALDDIRKNRLHMPFRTVFQRRSQVVPDADAAQ